MVCKGLDDGGLGEGGVEVKATRRSNIQSNLLFRVLWAWDRDW